MIGKSNDNLKKDQISKNKNLVFIMIFIII